VLIGDRPYVYPLARLDDQHPRCAVVVTDTQTARIMILNAGTVVEVIDVQSPKTRHTRGGGWSQSRLQRRVENAHRQHVKDVVEHLDQIVAAGQINHVVVAGDDVLIALLKEEMPERLARKLVDVRRLDVGTPEEDVAAVAFDALRRKDEEVDEAIVKDLKGSFQAGGLAVVGKDPVLTALRNGQVETLVITATPAQITGADRVANELVTRAFQTDSTVRFIENAALLGDVGGVAAALRYQM
jgi:peptide subunit release factor 1 (eRF1)